MTTYLIQIALITACIGLILFSVYMLLNIISYAMKRLGKKIEDEGEEGIDLFGYHIPTNDFISIIQTLACYLMSSDENTIQIANFISDEFLDRADFNGSCHIIEDAINELPIVHCRYVGRGRFVLDQTKTIHKYELYQEESKGDDYIIPMFQANVVSRNASFFNFPTRYQQECVVRRILRSEVLSHLFEYPEVVINRSKVTEKRELRNERRYRCYKDSLPPREMEFMEDDEFYSDRYPGQISIEEYLHSLEKKG